MLVTEWSLLMAYECIRWRGIKTKILLYFFLTCIFWSIWSREMESDDPIDIVDLYKAVIEACSDEALSKCDLYLEQPELVSPKPRENYISI